MPAANVPSEDSAQSASGEWTTRYPSQGQRLEEIRRVDLDLDEARSRPDGSGEAQARALVDRHVVELTRAYAEHYHELGPRTRYELMKLLARFCDGRIEPALRRAFDQFVGKPDHSLAQKDLKFAVRAQGELGLRSLSPLLLQVFTRLRAHSPLGALVYKDLLDALKAHPDPAWTPTLLEALREEIPPLDPEVPSSLGDVKNQVYWQLVAALLLGELRHTEAVRPLMRVVLDPLKGNVATTAVLALVKIGDPAVEAAIKLLRGEDQELARFHLARVAKSKMLTEAPTDEPYVTLAAVILGACGNRMAIEPMIHAAETNRHEKNRAKILDELTKIPATPQSKAAFKRGFEKLGLETRIPPRGERALVYLTEDSVTRFFDPEMVDWLIARAERIAGPADQKRQFRTKVLLASMKLAGPERMPKVKKSLPKYGIKASPDSGKQYFEEPLYEQAESVVRTCGKQVGCYLAHIEKAETQRRENEFGGIKAAYMIGIYGDPAAAAGLVERIDAIRNKSILMAALKAIDHLLPNGSAELADRLGQILETHKELGDPEQMAGDNAIREVMYRIRARSR